MGDSSAKAANNLREIWEAKLFQFSLFQHIRFLLQEKDQEK